MNNTECGGFTVCVIPCEDVQGWEQVLEECHCFDFHHLPSYHLMAQRRGEGSGILLVYREGAKVAAMPLLIRSLQSVPGLENCSAEWYDATSVYGYAGPVCSRTVSMDDDFAQRFGVALLRKLRGIGVICVFSRLHPILENAVLLNHVGEVLSLGKTVSIDLTLPPEMQFANYRKGHKYDINRARRFGVTARHDVEWKALDNFIRLYMDTMQRVGAREKYFFDQDYFLELRAALEHRLHLFVAEKGETVLAAALFTLTNSIVQYHLSASDPKYMKYAPSKVLLDEVRIWSTRQGARVFHLGGGVGSSEDGVFKFKAGFSDRRHRFKVWRCVVIREVYDRLVLRRIEWEERKDLSPISADHFPLYRRPVASEESSS